MQYIIKRPARCEDKSARLMYRLLYYIHYAHEPASDGVAGVSSDGGRPVAVIYEASLSVRELHLIQCSEVQTAHLHIPINKEETSNTP